MTVALRKESKATMGMVDIVLFPVLLTSQVCSTMDVLVRKCPCSAHNQFLAVSIRNKATTAHEHWNSLRIQKFSIHLGEGGSVSGDLLRRKSGKGTYPRPAA